MKVIFPRKYSLGIAIFVNVWNSLHILVSWQLSAPGCLKSALHKWLSFGSRGFISILKCWPSQISVYAYLYHIKTIQKNSSCVKQENKNIELIFFRSFYSLVIVLSPVEFFFFGNVKSEKVIGRQEFLFLFLHPFLPQAFYTIQILQKTLL